MDNPHNTSAYYYTYNDNIELIDITKIKDPIPILNVLCYDIETTTHSISKFPNPCLYSNKIV